MTRKGNVLPLDVAISEAIDAAMDVPNASTTPSPSDTTGDGNG
jgi:hypothetical protein